MKKPPKLTDPQKRPAKLPVGVTFSPDDLDWLRVIQRYYGFESRSSTIRACVREVYQQIRVK